MAVPIPLAGRIALAAVTAPARRSLVGAVVSAALSPAGRKLARQAMALAREHVVTFAAFTAIDWGCWDAGRVTGLVATGVSALVLDWLVRG